MQNTSTAFQFETNQTIRSRQYVRVKFGLVDVDAGPDAVFSSSNKEVYSSFDELANSKYVVNKSYATFENGRMKLNGTQVVASKTNPIYQGYVSSSMSNCNGIFEVVPTITIQFSKTHTSKGLSFTFDKSTGDYCRKVRIKTYRKSILIDDVTATFTEYYAIATNDFNDFDKIEVLFLESNLPYRRARLNTIVFGIGYIFENNDILSLTKTVEIDPLNRRLPTNKLSFKVQDLSLSYNIDSPSGIWDVMEDNLPVYAEFGQHIDQGLTWGDVLNETWAELERTRWGDIYEGGYTEWVNLGEYLLSAKPKTNKYAVTFDCQDVIFSLTQEYHRGTYSPFGNNLYDLAVQLVDFCKLLPRVDGKKHYIFSDKLKSIKTYAPLPIKPVRELLQLIAHAANCTFYSDINNIIRIEEINTVQDNLFLNFRDQLDLPSVSKIALLKGVISNVYNYFTESTVTEISKQTVTVTGTYEGIIKFEPSVDVVITSSTGALTSTIYAAAADIKIVGNGECEITVTGKKIISTKSEVVVATTEQNGEFDIEDNPLITDIETAKSQATYAAEYLSYRTNYNMNNVMGYPQLESGDLIYLQSQFTAKFPARILKHEFDFNSAGKSKIIAKRLVK